MDDRRAALAALLAQRRRDVESRLERLDVDERSILADRAAATADDEHDPEGSTLSGEWQRIEGFRRAAQQDGAEIDAAVRRMDAGTYGTCETCGRDIPIARLEARPMATRCVECAV